MAILKRNSHWLNALCFLSLFFQFGCGQPSFTTSDPPAVIPQSVPVSLTVHNTSVDFDLTASQAINTATVTIANRGKNSVLMPAVFAKGDSGLNRESILSLIQSAGTLTDEQFALATWRFVSQHLQHYCEAGAPGDPSNFALDPMRLLHAYGFACCDQSSVILSWLWRGAGYPAQVDEMTFHVVPEIYYQGGWHLYDADHEVYYLARDGKTVASLAEIIADPFLVARTADPNGNDPVGFSAQYMADQYAMAKPSHNNIPLSREAFWSLNPNQTFTLRSENLTNSVFSGPSIDQPLGGWIVNSGQFDWNLDFAQPGWESLANTGNGVGSLVNGADTFLTNTSANRGYVIYYFSSPFPVFSLTVSGIVYRKDSNATVNVFLMHDGSHWSAAFPMNTEVGSPIQTTADLTAAAAGQYSYFVMLQLSGDAANTAQIAAVHITSEVQTAKILFPKLVPGVVNHLIYQQWCTVPIRVRENVIQGQDVCSGDVTQDVKVSVAVE